MKTIRLAGCFLSLYLIVHTALAADQTAVMVHEAWINQPPPGTDVTAGYLMLHNTGPQAAVLKQVTSPDFGRVEMHRTVVQDGMAHMERQDSITIPANAGLTFKPGDYHLMLFQPHRSLAAGDSVKLSLEFNDATHLEATATVRRLEAGQDDHSQHQHH